MPLKLIHGPPNSGRAGLIRRGFVEALDREPVLVVPTLDDVFAFERELCAAGAALGGSVLTFRGLFRAVATAGGAPPGPELTRAQRLRAITLAIAECRRELGPLRRSAAGQGFAQALEGLLDELQDAGLDPERLGAAAETLEGSAYLDDLASIFAAYERVRDRLGSADDHVVSRSAVALLERSPQSWRGRPVFLYGLDDLTLSQRALIRSLATVTEVTAAITYEEGSAALGARSTLLERLRTIGVAEEKMTEADPDNTDEPLLFHLERSFGAAARRPRPVGSGLTILRSAGERGEAEAIAAHVARLLTEGAVAAEIAIALRDPVRRGSLLGSVLESYGIPVALEAEVPVASTSVGGTLIALLEAEMGGRRAGALLRFLRGPSGVRPESVDWFERRLRRDRVTGADAALERWLATHDDHPHDLARLRSAIAAGPAEAAAEVGRLARAMASRPLASGEDGPRPGRGDGLELRAAGAISSALAELAELGADAPRPEELAEAIGALRFRAWSGPVEGRVRIASPYRLRASRLDHVVVGSLQDGEFPKRDAGADPFLSEGQRAALGLEPRRDPDDEERYLFHACLALPRRSLCLSYRDCDENGGAEARSPLLDEVRALLDPPPDGDLPDEVEASLTRGRDLAQMVHEIRDAPSPTELARTIAARGGDRDPEDLVAAAGVTGPDAASISARVRAGRAAEAASRAPGPLTNPAVLESLAAVPAYGGTTLEGFDVCSYQWFVSHELSPQPLAPTPDPLIQGGLMHAVLHRLYEEQPGGDPLPRPASLEAWTDRGTAILAEEAGERLGAHPAERAIVRRVEGLLSRFLAEEARREPAGLEPWLLEAFFGGGEEAEREALAVGGWGLHGAIDRVDRAPDGRALVIDYKLAREVTPHAKFVEKAKLQLQLYLIAVEELWGARAVGGIYHPLGGTTDRRPRGAVLKEAAEDLPYGLVGTDLVERDEFERLLDDARARASEIVRRMRSGEIRRDPGPPPPSREHDVCPSYCQFAPICRRDRSAAEPEEEGEEER